MEEDPDLEVFMRLGTEPDAALRELQKRHAPLLRSVAGQAVQYSDVDDVLQEFWLKLLQQWTKFDPSKGLVMSWLITNVRRRSIDYWRRTAARAAVSDRLLETLPELHVEDESTDEEAADRELSTVVQAALDELPEAQRQCVELHYFGGLSHRDIANKTQTPLGTVKTRLEGALAKLGRILVPGTRT